MDKIYINGIRAFGYTGALPEENVLGQWFQVDLVLTIDLRTAGESDTLSDTFDYGKAAQEVQQLIQTQPFNLLETVASEIAKAVLSTDDRLNHITVKLTKLSPPVPHFLGNVVVEITRDRTHLQRTSPEPLKLSPSKA